MPSIDIPLDNLPLATPVRLEQEGMTSIVIRTSHGITAFHDRCPHAE
jgi:nitrite reductase/ring-hydroxylating ferredoxin subunit